MAGTCRELGTGELFVAGDVACKDGDWLALAAVAEHLIEHVTEPMHCELGPLARACRDPRSAAQAWNQLKERVEALR